MHLTWQDLKPATGEDAVGAKKAKKGKTAGDESVSSLYLKPELRIQIRRYSTECGSLKAPLLGTPSSWASTLSRRANGPKWRLSTRAVLH